MKLLLYVLVVVVTFACPAVHAATGDIGVIVIHGKWGSPGGPIAPLVSALQREGVMVSAPEMPWSGRRLYDQSVDEAETQIGDEIARLRERGAKHVFVIGHSLGAAFALRYATRNTPAGVVAIAPGHRPEGARYAQAFREELRQARELVAAGKPSESVGFTDLNTGARQSYVRAGAAVFLSYFDPVGPLNMARNVASVKPEVPVLWVVPTREEQPLRSGVVGLYGNLPRHPHRKFAEPEADHLGAPAASARFIVDWLREVAK